MQSGDPAFLRRTATGITVALRAQPRARRTALDGEGGALKAAVTAPAEDGRANQAIIDLLAGTWRLPKSAFAVTRGGESVLAWANVGRFAPMDLHELPVSARALRERSATLVPVGDTTGCGDAFAGGTIAALALRLAAGPGTLDLVDALSWGIAAGAFTLSFLGGTFYESRPGEKREFVTAYRNEWLTQAHGH